MGGPTRLKLVAQISRLRPDSNYLPELQGLTGILLLGIWMCLGAGPQVLYALRTVQLGSSMMHNLKYRGLYPRHAPKKFERGTRVPLAPETFYQEQS